jgi:hypothetical protein
MPTSLDHQSPSPVWRSLRGHNPSPSISLLVKSMSMIKTRVRAPAFFILSVSSQSTKEGRFSSSSIRNPWNCSTSSTGRGVLGTRLPRQMNRQERGGPGYRFFLNALFGNETEKGRLFELGESASLSVSSKHQIARCIDKISKDDGVLPRQRSCARCSEIEVTRNQGRGQVPSFRLWIKAAYKTHPL